MGLLHSSATFGATEVSKNTGGRAGVWSQLLKNILLQRKESNIGRVFAFQACPSVHASPSSLSLPYSEHITDNTNVRVVIMKPVTVKTLIPPPARSEAAVKFGLPFCSQCGLFQMILRWRGEGGRRRQTSSEAASAAAAG